MERSRTLRESSAAGQPISALDTMSDTDLRSLIAAAERILEKRAFAAREAEQERAAFASKYDEAENAATRDMSPDEAGEMPSDLDRAVEHLERMDAEGKLNEFTESLLSQWRRFGRLSDKQIGAVIKYLDRIESRKAGAQQHSEVKVTEPGVYEHEGVIYVVKFNKEKTNLYAKQIRELNSTRLTEAGEVVEIEFDYAPGAVFKLSPDEKMPLDRAKHYTLRYGRCLVCGRHLRKAESVERGIGPVCIKSFS